MPPISPAPQQNTPPNPIKGLVNSEIKNEEKSRSEYLKTHYALPFYGSIAFSVAIFIILVWLGTEHSQGEVTFSFAFCIPIITLGVWYGFAGRQLEAQFMQQYAQLHNFSFTKKPQNLKLVGPLYKIGHGKRVTDLISGSLPGVNQFILFLYHFTIGYGRDRQIMRYCVVNLYLPESGPHLYLQSRLTFKGALLYSYDVKSSFKQAKEYELEGNFNSVFKVYGEQGDQIDLLEIINPAVMERLLNMGLYDIELYGNVLSFYRPGMPESAASIDNVLEVGQLLVSSFAPIMQRMDMAASSSQTIQAQ